RRAHRDDPDACRQYGVGRWRLDDIVFHRTDHAPSHPAQRAGHSRSKRPGSNVKRSTERILTTHVGSLVRPPAILESILNRAAGRDVDEDAFERLVSGGVRGGVRKQAEVGIDIPSDGEFSKPNFFGYATERLEGLG